MQKIDENAKKAIALKKFSIIAPVLNNQVASRKQYFKDISSKAIEMPYLGARTYSPKTLETWLYDYTKAGLDGLIRPHRSDKGKPRKIPPELGELIIAKDCQNNKTPDFL